MRWSTWTSKLHRLLLKFLTLGVCCHLGAALRVRPLAIMPHSLKLGSDCKSSMECLLFVPNSHCNWHEGAVCDCQPYHVRYNNTMCLKGSLLSYGCVMDEQCTSRVPHSRCGENGLCGCQDNYIPYRLDKCLPPAKLEDFCLNDLQCRMANTFSYCKYIIPRVYGKCKCPTGYMLTHDQGCMPYLESECGSNDDCRKVTPNSQCIRKGNKNVCACSEGYRTSGNKIRCEADKYVDSPSILSLTKVKPVNRIPPASLKLKPQSLGKVCNYTRECQLRDKYSDCIDGVCQCVHPTSTCSKTHTGCLNDTFQCNNGQCISWFFVCDGMKNCADGSDESGCKKYHCPLGSFQCDDGTCKSRATVCNGKWECPDGSDEARCYKGIKCDRNAFQCKNGQCLPKYVFCNAVVDCTDGSDEDQEACIKGESCPADSFRCKNKMCRSSAILCSGVDGCGDNSDEIGCSVCKCDKPPDTSASSI
ncbi:low-density lipoprotein receptor-related protein 1B-like isoform X2 [Ornithodoros turicata]